MNKLKSLVADTVVYGFSTILGRLLNWLLTPFYIRTIIQSDFGVVINLYSIIAILLVVATLGFETGYFRFVTNNNRTRVFDSLVIGISVFGVFWFSFLSLFQHTFSVLLEIEHMAGPLLLMAGAIVWVDSINSIPFAELRFQRKSRKYAILRLLQVLITVLFNILFLIILRNSTLGFISFSSQYAVFYILLANILGSLFITLYFAGQLVRIRYYFDLKLFKQIFLYSLPLVGMGLFGMLNQNIEKIMIVKLIDDPNPYESLAIYGANYKIGVLMAIFTQSFRMAFEPFFFKENKENADPKIYGVALYYFVIFGLLIYSGILCFLPAINLLLTSNYLEGNVILPYILGGQLFFGIYYSFSIWYKVTDKTYFGILMSFSGLAVNVGLNFILIPAFGYFGAAIGTFFGYLVMMLISYFLGNKYYPIAYPVKLLFGYALVVVLLTALYLYLSPALGSYGWILGFFTFLLISVVLLWRERSIILQILRHGKFTS